MTEYMELKAMRNDKTSDDEGALHPAENGLEAAKPIPTPPNEEDPHTLTAYGDISLSDIDFVPGPPSEISPSQMTKKKEKWRFPRKDSEKMTRFPSITNRVRPPSFSKGRAKEADLTFDKLVMDLKRDAEKSRSLSKGTGMSSVKGTSEDVQIHSPQPKRLIDLKGLRGEVPAISARRDDAGAVPSTSSKTVDEPTRYAVVSGDENGASAPKKPLRGNGKLPKRPPIPRWDVDNSWNCAGGEGPPFKLGMTTWAKLT